MPLTLLLAWRFLQGAKSKGTISTMILVCFFSITISTGALTLVAAIMHGFEKATYEKLQGTHSDLTLSKFNQPLNFGAIQKVLKQEFSDSVLAISPTSTGQILIRSNPNEENEQEPSQVVLLKGIDPILDSTVSTLSKTIIIPKTSSTENWGTLLTENGIIIGKTLADELMLNVGDPVDLLYSSEEVYLNKLVFDSQPAIIKGIFKTGIFEFDKHIVICSLNFFKNLLGQSDITQISLKLANNADEEIIKQTLMRRLSLEVHSWKDFYPALVSALKLEKFVMIFILSLVAIIAAMNIISLLYMLIAQKRRQIAVLKVMGLCIKEIQNIFIIISMIITSVAAILGIALASIISWLLTKYPIITLPDVYYVTHLPSELTLHIIIIVFIGVIFISLLATLIPVRFTLLKESTDLLA